MRVISQAPVPCQEKSWQDGFRKEVISMAERIAERTNGGANTLERQKILEEELTSVGASARVFLQPIAAPSILGLYGFAGATLIVAANLAGWYNAQGAALYLFPFAAFFGGLAQFLAGMWSYRARDGLATAMHGMWGSFWMAYGLLNLLFATGTLTPPTGPFVELGFWFIALAAITWVGTWAAVAVARSLTAFLGFLAAGSTVMAIAQIIGAGVLTTIAGWLFIIAAVLAWYTASALMLNSTYGRQVLPLGLTKIGKETPPISLGVGEPGVIHGQ
jgi:succinate-acetate transporter protein